MRILNERHNFYTISHTTYTKQTEQAEKLLGVGESKSDEEIPAAERAAWTLVASTLFNLDETLTRE